MATGSTRSTTERSLFGSPCELPKRQLPTREDVFKAYCWKSYFDESLTRLHDRAQSLAEEVKNIYESASIPSNDIVTITVHIKRLVGKARELDKYPKSERCSEG